MVCLTCRKAFSTATDDNHMPITCPECGNGYIFYNHKFRPPKKNDLKAWEVVSFLHENGFNYQHVHADTSVKNWWNLDNYADYPKSLSEAREFVIKYKSQAKISNS